ncbi:AAA family ATPase, partial [Heyndrickxia faecalis]
QSELWDRLRLQSFAAIRQRIDIQFKLGYYDRAQATEYITMHLQYSGVTEQIFTDVAFSSLPLFSFFPSLLLKKICTKGISYGAQNRHR